MADVEIDGSDTLPVGADGQVLTSVRQLPQDIASAGWSEYRIETFIPSVIRKGERFRKDRWSRRE